MTKQRRKKSILSQIERIVSMSGKKGRKIRKLFVGSRGRRY